MPSTRVSHKCTMKMKRTPMKHCAPQEYLSIPSGADDALSLTKTGSGVSHSSKSSGPVLLPVINVASSPKPVPADVLAPPNCSASSCDKPKIIRLNMRVAHTCAEESGSEGNMHS